MRIKITSFQELTMELIRQADGSSKTTITETKQLDIETTGSVFANIMPCSFPNPEQLLSGIEESAGRRWDMDININGTREAYVNYCVNKAYS